MSTKYLSIQLAIRVIFHLNLSDIVPEEKECTMDFCVETIAQIYEFRMALTVLYLAELSKMNLIALEHFCVFLCAATIKMSEEHHWVFPFPVF